MFLLTIDLFLNYSWFNRLGELQKIQDRLKNAHATQEKSLAEVKNEILAEVIDLAFRVWPSERGNIQISKDV